VGAQLGAVLGRDALDAVDHESASLSPWA
jgi:hypothetical protein